MSAAGITPNYRRLFSACAHPRGRLLTKSRLQNTNSPAKLNNFSPSVASD